MAKPTAKIPKRAHGRSLADFGVLSAAEADFVGKTRLGEWCLLGNEVPEASTIGNTIRAGLIRFLALGGDETAPVHEKGVQLQGAWVDDVLDLEGGEMPHNLQLPYCQFHKAPVLRTAQGKTVVFTNSSFPGMSADGLIISGSLFLKRAKSTDVVRLLGAQIGGGFECDGGNFKNPGGIALYFEGANVGGNVFLRYRFHAVGEVRLSGVKIGGDFDCTGGKFEAADGDALSCAGADIAGNVLLRNQFYAKGAVVLASTKIGASLACRGGIFENPNGYALTCGGLSIRSAIMLRAAKFDGIILLTHAEATTLYDDVVIWPTDKLLLDGFRYIRISTTSPTDARTRIAWLKKQHRRFLHGPEFAVQPWTHLAKVLRESGHERDAVTVEIERERLLAASGRMGKGMALRLHQIYGVLADYGYRPLKPLRFALGTWLWFALLYAVAGQNGWFGPSNPLVFQNPAYAHCRPDFVENSTTRPKYGNWVTCPELPGEYTSFSPLIYSLDTILPVIELGQARDWGPITPSPPLLQKFNLWQDALIPMVNEPVTVFDQRAWTPGLVLRFLTWTEQLLGWIFGIVLAGALTGLFQRKGE